jgi:hypothetical protein
MADMLDRLKAALAGRYAIERELGSGGMATVWLARDVRYARQVAVKVLRPDLSAALGADRFLREIRITAQLNHPHILPLLDSGEADGLLFYVMPYVAGGSLRERLRRGESWTLDSVLPLVRGVAAALEHAHRQGIIHRDVKPENVLFFEGEPMVADFGIARAITSAGGDQLTRSGFPVGTPGYMSPEQAMGGALVDARTDVFGLGCVVYEMLVGETPPIWPTDEALRVGRFLNAPDSHRTRLERLPGRVEQTLVRALAVHAPDRFHTPLAFVDALDSAASGTAKLGEPAVHAVLRRAAALEVERPTDSGALSLGAVEQVAAQVGIPPEHVRAAAREVAGAAPFDGSRLPAPLRAPPEGVYDRKRHTYVAERSVAREVTAAQHAALVMEIQDALQMTGNTTVLGGGLSWAPTSSTVGGMPWAGIPGRPAGRQVTVTIAPDGGRTRIRVEEHLGGATGSAATASTVLAVLAAGLIGAAVLKSGGGAPALTVLVPAIAIVGTGVVFGSRVLQDRQVRDRGPELAALAERLAVRIASKMPALPHQAT